MHKNNKPPPYYNHTPVSCIIPASAILPSACCCCCCCCWGGPVGDVAVGVVEATGDRLWLSFNGRDDEMVPSTVIRFPVGWTRIDSDTGTPIVVLGRCGVRSEDVDFSADGTPAVTLAAGVALVLLLLTLVTSGDRRGIVRMLGW